MIIRSWSRTAGALGLALVGCTVGPDPRTQAETEPVAASTSSASPRVRRPLFDRSAPSVKSAVLPFRTKDGATRQVPVEVHRGRAYLGDMGFGPVADMHVRGVGIASLDERWPKGRVPFCYYEGTLYPELHAPSYVRPIVEAATEYLHDRVPSISFENHGTCPPEVDGLYTEDMVVIVRHRDDDGNDAGWSRADKGYEGGAQLLELAKGIGENPDPSNPLRGRGTVVHELMHTLGMHHEHQRSDRDSHVHVCWYSVGRPGDFEIEDDQVLLTPYDFFSRMHYEHADGKVDGPGFPDPECVSQGDTLAALYDTASAVPGDQRDVMSSNYVSLHDINALSLMYGPALSMPLPDESYGASVAVADFDKDGYDDLVIGAPGALSGSAYLYKGTFRHPAPRRRLAREASATNGDRFGAAMAVGDFNGDGFPDLAVGAPQAVRSGQKAGGVTIYFGGRFAGVTFKPPSCDADCMGTDTDMTALTKTLSASNNLLTSNLAGDEFGAALVAGDFDGDGLDDLVVGAPGKTSGQGAAFFYRGSTLAGTSSSALLSSSRLTQANTGTVLGGARFGSSFAAGDFDGDGKLDLAIGGPGHSLVYLHKGTGAGSPAGWPDASRIRGPLTGDEFGFSLAAGRLFGSDTRAELVIGAPRAASAGGIGRGGAVYVYQFVAPVRWYQADVMATGSTTEVRFGHTVAVTSFNQANHRPAVAIGAPAYDGGRGRVLIATSDDTQLVAGPDVKGEGGWGGLGTAIATGNMRMKLFDFANPVDDVRLRFFVGAPSSKDPTLGLARAGSVFAFGATTDTPFILRSRLTALTKSPWSN